MRRRLAAAAMAAGLFAVAGCGDDNGDGAASTEEVCQQIDETITPLEGELGPAIGEAGAAAAIEDEEAVAEAMIRIDEIVDEVTTALRDGAADAEDEDFSEALEEFASSLEDLVASVASGENPDLSRQEAAADRIDSHCNSDGNDTSNQ